MADLLEAIKGLLLHGEKYADLIFRCEGESIKAHSAIVCLRSRVLAAEVEPQLKKMTRTVHLSEDELPAVRAMIDYLYTGDYNYPVVTKSDTEISDEIENVHTPSENAFGRLDNRGFQVEEPASEPVTGPASGVAFGLRTAEDDDKNFGWGSRKKRDEKKCNKDIVEEIAEKQPEPFPEPEIVDEWAPVKKGKKGKKNKPVVEAIREFEDPIAEAQPEPEPEPEIDGGFGFSSLKKVKKIKPLLEDTPEFDDPISEPDYSWGSSKIIKKLKGKAGIEDPVPEPAPEPEPVPEDLDFGWGLSRKKVKQKKSSGFFDDYVVEPPVEVCQVREEVVQMHQEPCQPELPVPPKGALLFDVKMYLIGQKYEISGLIDLAKAKYEAMVRQSWNTPDYSASAELLWEKGDAGKGLRDTIARAAKENIRDMLKRDEFKALIVSHGEFALEVLERVLG